MSMNMNMHSLNTSSSAMTQHGNEMNDRYSLVNVSDYQSAQALVVKASKIFNDKLKFTEIDNKNITGYITNLEKRIRLTSPDPEERIVHAPRSLRDLEAMPFPLDGKATGFEDMLKEEERLGELNYNVPPIQEVSAQDLVEEAYKELRARAELQEEYQRLSKIAEKWGY